MMGGYGGYQMELKSHKQPVVPNFCMSLISRVSQIPAAKPQPRQSSNAGIQKAWERIAINPILPNVELLST